MLAVALFAVGVPAATALARDVGRKDPGIVVIDEVIGMVVATIGVGLDLWNLLAAFCLFRFFDILKPWPCRALERLPRGWGIVMDDVCAGFYTLGVMNLLMRWIR